MAEAPTPKLMALSDLKAAHRRSLTAIASIAEEEIGAMAKTAAGTTAPVKNQSAKASLLQANVNEMCAATYTHLFRHYFPTSDASKEAKAAIDPKLLARMRELEEQIKATEESIQGYRTQLPLKIRDIVQTDFDAKAKLTGVKRKLPDVAATLVAPTLPDLSDVQASFTQTAAKIHELKNNLPVTIQEASDTIRVIEHAIKRPKAHIDVLMEGGPGLPSTAPTPSVRATVAAMLQQS